jgi:hypothetical protein
MYPKYYTNINKSYTDEKLLYSNIRDTSSAVREVCLKQGSACESKSFTDILLHGDYCHGCDIL